VLPTEGPQGSGATCFPPASAQSICLSVEPTTEAAEPKRHVHPALFGLLIMPFGTITGYCGVTLPRLFELEGQTATAIAAFQALAMQPHSFKFLIEPMLDARYRKKSWFLWSIAITALMLPLAIFVRGRNHGLSLGARTIAPLSLLVAILFVANAAVATSSGAMHALMATTLPVHKKGAAAGWAMAGNLGGYGVGGAIGLFVTQKMSTGLAAALMTALVVACAAPAFFIEEEEPEAHPLGRAILRLLRDTWKTVKSKQGWTGLVICLSPVGAGGATGLFSAMASEYQAGDQQVALVNGLFGGIVSALGCVVGGYVADRMNRRLVYALAGAASAAVAIGMSMMKINPSTYTYGCLAYSFVNGIAFAAWAAFVLDLMGHDAGVATKHALFAAAANQATNYMTVLDGLASDRKILGGRLGKGAVAVLRADALQTVIGLLVIGVMVFLVRRLLLRPPPPEVAVEPA
jgi:PAT family beta-lactamase induction signal transducer AmpG